MKRLFLLVAFLLALGLVLPIAAVAQTIPGTAQTWLVTWAKSDNNFSQDVSATHVTLTNKGTTSPLACPTAVVFYDKAGAVICTIGGPVPPGASRTLCSAQPAPAVSSNCEAVCAPELFMNYEGFARIYVGTSFICQADIVVDARVHFTPQDETNASAIHGPNVVRTRPLNGAGALGAQIGD